jgi:hypothetical protein
MLAINLMNLERKNILFVTTSNLTTNPRLLKELNYLSAFHECTFVGFHYNNWSASLEKEIKASITGVRKFYLPVSRESLFFWLLTTLINKSAKAIYPYFQSSGLINAFASDKRSFVLFYYLKFKGITADIIIGHNLGTLFSISWFSKKKQIPFVFDVEDYYPGEKVPVGDFNEKKRREWLLRKFLPDAALVTYASPMIGEKTSTLLNGQIDSKLLLIDNVFNSSEFDLPKKTKGGNGCRKLRLVWFSQNIDKGRGLESILELLDNFTEHVEVHLIGNARKSFVNDHLKNRSYIVLHGCMNQKSLHRLLSQSWIE